MNIKTFIPKNIIIILILVIFLNTMRIILFKSNSFVWLFWNIFLAIIPFIISSVLLWHANQGKLSKTTFIIWGILWLLFIPNAPYIVTDLIHIGVVRAVPVLYDSFLLFSAAWVGLYLGLYSIFHIDKILRIKYSKITTEITLFIIMLFIGFGIYLGRFLRFNSWDVFNPSVPLLKTVHQTFLNPTGQAKTYMYLILFVFFVYIFYLSFRFTKKQQ